MEITIGILHLARELTIDCPLSASQIQSTVASALEQGSGVLSLPDQQGKVTLLPVGAVGYVQIGEQDRRFVGFSA